jgi:HD-like signal output (HDOD) protein/ActR/RegA family two-component response regulator
MAPDANADRNRKRILFVDDEPKMLRSLERMLRFQQREWEMAFVSGAPEALDRLRLERFDIVVSDLRMPGMDGIALLNLVKTQHPGMVRFILSGFADRETILQSVGPTHHFLTKPCRADALKRAVERAFALREVLQEPGLLKLIAEIGSLPALPDAYQRLTMTARAPTSTIQDITGSLSGDPALAAKILHLVNSASLGLRGTVEDLGRAIALLGVEPISGLVLSESVFSALDPGLAEEFHVGEIHRHSEAVGAAARDLLAKRHGTRKAVDEATFAGLTHDFGKVVLVERRPALWRDVLACRAEEELPLCAAEREVLGATHAQVGAYLLGAWGISDTIVEAVAFHHEPARCLNQTFGALTAVHMANYLDARKCEGAPGCAVPDLDAGYLKALGVTAAQLKQLEGVYAAD